MLRVALFVLMASQFIYAQTESFVGGRISTEKSCEKETRAHVFLSSGKTLIYHNDIPIGGTFRFHVMSGKYDLRVATPNNCISQQNIILEKPVEDIDLVLKKDKRQPACAWGYCPTIGETGFMQPAINYRMPSLPYWMNYRNPYTNFFYPGPWMMNSWNLNPGFFPGGGHYGAAKPNLYFSVTKKQEVEVSVDYKNPKTRWLAAIPAPQDNRWKVKIEPHKDPSIDGVSYPYVFYDFRGYDDELQASSGFCEKRNEAIDKMKVILRQAHFRKKEVEDFEEYWRIKMPPADELCVFPQSEKELDKTAKIISKPDPRKVTRRMFVVVPKHKNVFYGQHKFVKEPSQLWDEKKETPILNFKSDLELREWGVALLFNP
jgi:hypothetical protein